MMPNTARQVFLVEWFSRNQWKKTYFGTDIMGDRLYFNTSEEARQAIEDVYTEQKNQGRKKLPRYRIVDRIISETIVYDTHNDIQ
jgi:hypothetical protein